MIPQCRPSFGGDRASRVCVAAATVLVAGASTLPAADPAAGEPSLGRAAAGAASRGDMAIGRLPDPLKGTPKIPADKTGQDAEKVLARMLKPRSDSWADWSSGVEPLHACGEPRALPPCVPPPPCHPSQPPDPYDLVGVPGEPSCGPIYEGPCAPRTGTHDACAHPHLHRLSDRFFDLFYMWK